MVALLLTTTISCTQALSVVHRLVSVVGLTEVQKSEIIQEIRKVIPSCPIKVVKQ
jgi:hypothetical protein